MPQARRIRIGALGALLLALLCPALAADPPEATVSDQARYRANLERWRKLTPAQREHIRDIARRLTPERLQALRQRLRHLERMDKPTRAAVAANHQRLAKATPERRAELMRRYFAFRAKPQAERERIRRLVWRRLVKRFGRPIPLLAPDRAAGLRQGDPAAAESKAPPADRSGWRKAPEATKAKPPAAKANAKRLERLKKAKQRLAEREAQRQKRPAARQKAPTPKPTPPKSTVDRSKWRKGTGAAAPRRGGPQSRE